MHQSTTEEVEMTVLFHNLNGEQAVDQGLHKMSQTQFLIHHNVWGRNF